MKVFSFIALLVFIFSNFSVVFAVTWNNTKIIDKNTKQILKDKEKTIKSKKEDIVKAWKEKKRELIKQIYEQTNISSLMDLSTAATQLDNITEKLKNLSISYKTVKLQKKSIDKKYKAVLSDARDLILKLNKKSNELKNTLFKIQILSKDLENMKQQVNNIKDTIYISKKQVKKYVSILYKINNDYYNNLDWLDDIKLLVKSNNIAKTLSQENIIKILSLKTQELLSKLKNSEKVKKKFLKKMYLKRVEYINIVNEYKTQIEILNNKKKFLVDLLTMLKTNKKQIDKLYNRLHKNRLNLKKQQIKIAYWMSQVLSWTEFKAKPIDLSNILQYTIKTDWDKFFSWPSKDYHTINAYFHDKNYYKKFWFEHDGIDIAMPQWSSIYAPAAWYVYKVIDNPWDYYNYVVIVHNYWYVTIYWHITKSLVKEWDIVKRWQIIAKSGWIPWTRWAGKLSTWPHLHFEIRKNWQLIDPFTVLDLSVYKDKSEVPLDKRIKYIKDKITRKIDLSNVKFYPLNIWEKDRISMFLNSRAAPWFKSYTWWIEMWKKTWIDPAVAICIWYAESGLWHNTASKNNVGNVWNNDRWDRRWYPTPQAGINAIFYALNNKYLSKYYTIYSLSRYWNKDAHIYSSSTFSWYKNVVKCLSTIKWYPIDEYYPFRIK